MMPQQQQVLYIYTYIMQVREGGGGNNALELSEISPLYALNLSEVPPNSS